VDIIDSLAKLGVPKEAIDPSSLDGLTSVSGSTEISIICGGCGSKKRIKVSSALRTVRRSGRYKCLSCGIKEKHEDPAYQASHSSGVKSSWTAEKRQRQSAISKDMWADPTFAEKVRQSSTDTWSSGELRAAASDRTKSLWENPEYRAKYEALWADVSWREQDSRRIRDLWRTEAYRARQEAFKRTEEHRSLQSELARKRWEDPAYRSLVVESQKLLWDDPEVRARMSEAVTALWKDPEYLRKQREAAEDPGLIAVKSANAKRQWENPDVRQSIVDGIKLAWEDPDYRQRASEIAKRQWEDPAYRQNQAEQRANMLRDGKDSILERTAQNLLSSLGVEYVRHHVVGYFEFDLFIPAANLLIECNGEYWHSLRKSQDAAKFTYVDRYFPEYRVLYLWERDFLNPGLIRQKLVSELLGGDEPPVPPIDFSLRDVAVRPVGFRDPLPGSYYSSPEEFLQAFHYAGFGRSAKAVYGAYLGDSLIGVAKFCSPVRQEVATSSGFAYGEVLELDRFCIHPQYQKKNFASWLLSRASSAAFSDNPVVRALVSFADSSFGHRGTIYRAANWGVAGFVRPGYHYVSPDGFVVHKKTLWDHASRNGFGESEYAAANGYVKVVGKEKIKFILLRVS